MEIEKVEKLVTNLPDKTVFRKTLGNGRKNIIMKLLATERRRNYLILEPDNHTTMLFTENL